jgi:fibronectin-binding autotransporter adhesin
VAIVQNSGTSALVLSGANTYSGGTTVSAGTIRFNSAASIGGSGRDVTVGEGTTIIGGYAINNAFLNRLVETDNAVVIALAANSGNDLDFSSAAGATLGGAALGAVGAVTYSGTLTPGGTAYWLGGGGGTLTVSSALAGSTDLGINDAAGGKVILSGTNAHGSTYINAGTLQFNAAEAIGGTDRSVNAFAGTTVAAGYAMDNAFLNRLTESSDAFTVALAANSGNDLDFSSSAGATLPNASLGASGGSYTYSGTLTPNGTTYRLGGGGTLTVSSSTLTGDNSLEVTGPGTVVLSGAGNTFTGATTVNSGTLQIASAGAFNNISRAVTVNAGATATFSAADAAQAAAVTVDAGGTGNFTAANAANGGTFAVSGTGTVTVANAASGGSFTINAGGVLAAVNVDNAYAGAVIRLDGGKLRFGVSGTTTPRVSGATNILVRADSVLNSYNSSAGRPVTTLQYGAVDFAAADPVARPNGYLLDVTDTGCQSNYQPAKTTTRLSGSTIGNSGWIRVNRNCAETDTHKVELYDTAIRAGKTVTITQVGGGTSLLSGSLGVGLLGGAEMLGTNAFTMLSAAAANLTDASTFDTTDGLWARSGTTSIAATLADSKGTLALGTGEGVWFSAEDAACVTLTGLTAGSSYTLNLVLADAGDQATVLAQLAKNPAFSNIAAGGGQGISLEFTAPAETIYFAWDNVHASSADWHLGGNLIGVGGQPPAGTMIIVR